MPNAVCTVMSCVPRYSEMSSVLTKCTGVNVVFLNALRSSPREFARTACRVLPVVVPLPAFTTVKKSLKMLPWMSRIISSSVLVTA